MENNMVTQEVLRELLNYDPDTGVVTWRARDRRWFKSERSWKTWNSRFSGERAGTEWADDRTGYQCRYIGILGKNHKEHRIAWMWMTGEPIPPQIDHENRDATDNRWLNLRASTKERTIATNLCSPIIPAALPGFTGTRRKENGRRIAS